MHIASLAHRNVRRRTRRLAGRLRLSTIRLARIRTRPRILRHWLSSAHAAQLAFVGCALFLWLLLPSIRDALTDSLVPGENLIDGVSGIFGAESRSDRARSLLGDTITLTAWLTLSCTVLLLLWLHIPKAYRRSRTLTLAWERSADSLKKEDPRRRLQLYRSALGMTLDSVVEARLREKIVHLQNGHAVSSAGSKPTMFNHDSAVQASSGVRASASVRSRGHLIVAGRYECLSVIGRGGSGVVHRALDRVLDRELAIKELPVLQSVQSDSAARFRQEARALARLNHPGIIQVHDLIEDHERLWIAMELVSGGDLDGYLQSHGPLSVEHACLLGKRMADALSSAHEHQVVHRDLKPLNILLVDSETPKITDFGLAKLNEGPAHTIQGTVVGSPHYMSPEQCLGAPMDNRCDVYSLGVILYEMLSGRVPFDGETRSILAQHINSAPIPLLESSGPSEIPLAIAKLVMRMLEKDPGDRPQGMHEVRDALGAEVTASPILSGE